MHQRPPPARPLRIRLLLASAAAALLPSPLPAATPVTWTSPVNAYWSNPANWSTNSVPNNGSPSASSTYDVFFTTGATLYLDTDATVDSLTIGPSVALRHFSGTLRAATLNLAGHYALNGGHLADTALSLTPAASIALGPNTTFDAVDFLTDASLRGDHQRPGLTLLNPKPLRPGTTLSFGQPTSDGLVAVTWAGDITGAGTLRFQSTTIIPHNLLLDAPNPAIAPAVTIRSDSGAFTLASTAAAPITNHGTLTAQAAGRTFSVTSPLINHGSILASNATTLTLPALTNHGSLSVSANSTLNLAGANHGSISLTDSTLRITAPLTGNPITLTNSTASIAGPLTTAQALALPIPGPLRLAPGGQIDNSNATLTLSATDRPWILAGGLITGGTISSPDATPLVAAPGSSRLSSLTLAAPVVVNDGATLTLASVTNLCTVTVDPGATLHFDSLPADPGNLTFRAGSILQLPSGTLPSAVAHLPLHPDTHLTRMGHERRAR